MSKIREILGLPLEGDLTVEQITEAFDKKQLVDKGLLDTKLTELGDKTKELRRLQDDYGKLKQEHETYLEANQEPIVDPEKIKLEKRIEALEREKVRARAEADLLNGGVAPELVKTLIGHINLNEENSEDVITTITEAIKTREGQLKQDFLKSGVRVEPPAGGANRGSSEKTAREKYEAVDFTNYEEVSKYIKENPEDYAKFRNKK